MPENDMQGFLIKIKVKADNDLQYSPEGRQKREKLLRESLNELIASKVFDKKQGLTVELSLEEIHSTEKLMEMRRLEKEKENEKKKEKRRAIRCPKCGGPLLSVGTITITGDFSDVVELFCDKCLKKHLFYEG